VIVGRNHPSRRPIWMLRRWRWISQRDVCEVAVANQAYRIVDRRRLTGHNKTAIALANKLARVIWAVWHREVDCHAPVAAPEAA
jgi:hypothetical protein